LGIRTNYLTGKLRSTVLYDLLTRFSDITGVPILLNTSFNRENEPMVETPTDAIKTFMATELDALVIENFLLVKK